MAQNNATFSLKCDASNASYTLTKTAQLLDKIYIKAEGTGKAISKINNNIINATNWGEKAPKHINPSDTIARSGDMLEAAGRKIKSFRIHGVDPATNSLARFVNVVGGSLFNKVTTAITAIMLLGNLFRKLVPIIFDSFEKLASKSQSLAKIFSNRAENLQKEHNLTKNILDELIKLNNKLVLSTAEQNQQLLLLTRIRDRWGDINILIDKSTGKIKNINELLARLNVDYIRQQDKNYQQMINFAKAEADALLALFTGQGSWFNYKDIKAIRKRDVSNLDVTDFFPWIQSNADKNKLDLSKLIFGDTTTRIDFLYDLGQLTKDPKAYEFINKILVVFLKIQGLEAKQISLFNPYENIISSFQEQGDLVDKFNEAIQKGTEAIGKTRDNISKAINDLKYERLPLLEQKTEQQKRFANAQTLYENIASNLENYLRLNGGYLNGFLKNPETGLLESGKLKELVQNNVELQELYQEMGKVDHLFSLKLRKYLGDSINEYARSKKIVADYEKRLENSPNAMTVPTAEVLKAQNFLKKYGDIIEQYIDNTLKERLNKINELKETYLSKANDELLIKAVTAEINRIKLGRKIALNILAQSRLLLEAGLNVVALSGKLFRIEDSIAEKAVADAEKAARLAKERAEEVARKRKSLIDLGNSYIAKYMKDTGQEYSLRRQLILKLLKLILGVNTLNKNQKNIAKRFAYIEQLQNALKMEDQLNPFKYGVKTNELASKGGWSSSVYVSGRDSIAQLNLKVNQNQLKIQQLIGKLLPELKKLMNTLNKNLQI